MSIVATARTVVLGAVVLFSLITAALSIHINVTTGKYFRGYFQFSAMSLATALLSLFSIPAMLVIDNIRKGALTSMIIVELGWFTVLWVLWLAAAGLAAQATGGIWPSGCGFSNRDVDTLCREFPAVTAFSFLAWILLLAYTVTLLVLTITAGTRGYSVWYQTVAQTDFFAPPHPAVVAATAATQVPPVGFVQPNMTGTPVNYPPVGTPMGQPSQLMPQYPQPSSAAPGWTGQPDQGAQSPYPQV